MNTLRRKVLFVCTGNTCRSPMAEHLFRKLVSDAGWAGVEVRSAGVSPVWNLKLPSEAATVLAEENVRDVRHTASGLDTATVDWADLILTMEASHRSAVTARFPQARERTHVLRVFAGTARGRDGIADPYGGDVADYRAALDDIKAALAAIIRHWKSAAPEGATGK